MSSLEWWRVWWPWMSLWSVTVLAVLALPVMLLVQWRNHGRRSGRLAVSFYLNPSAVMGMYQQLRYQPSLQRAVREEIKRSSNADVRAAFPGVEADAGWRVDRQIFREYIEMDEPITVIGLVMSVLEKTDDIVHVDLERQTITPNRTLLGATSGGRASAGAPRGAMRLHDVDAHVLIKGVYRPGDGERADSIVFVAPYGEDYESQGPRVHIDCDTGGLRRRVPDGPFLARCLGRVERWDARTGEMVIDPIAVFK